MIDHNCYIGYWPFYKLSSDFKGLCSKHRENNIEYGYVSSLQSIFYNDFYESESELAQTIENSGYRQVVTVNPMLSYAPLTLEKCISDFDVAGVRIFPAYHNYSMDVKELDSIVDILKKYSLPLFIGARMYDERTSYFIEPKSIDLAIIGDFIENNRDIKIVLSHFKSSELKCIVGTVGDHPSLCWDTTGLYGNALEEPELHVLYERAVFGSGFPLLTVKSGALILENELDKDIKERLKIRTI